MLWVYSKKLSRKDGWHVSSTQTQQQETPNASSQLVSWNVRPQAWRQSSSSPREEGQRGDVGGWQEYPCLSTGGKHFRMLPFLDEAQTAHEGRWCMHICMQGRWFGNVFLLPHGQMNWKSTETRESSWRVVLPTKVQLFYKREEQKYEIQVSQRALYIRGLRTDVFITI